MVFGWIKNYLPRGLYGRAALILLLPIVTLQIVVSIVFVQRHFEDVTRQMTATTAVTLNYVLDQAVEAGATAAQDDAGAALGVRITPAATVPDGDGRLWYDLSGVTVLNALPTHLDTRAIDLTVNRRVIAWVAGADGSLWQLDFPRRNVSARNPHQLLVLLIFAGVIMAVVAFIFLRNQLRPIRRLARAAEEFGRGRHRDYTPAGATEVRAAGAAFLDMRARIERQIEQRTLLLSGVSHDLRTPLTRLRLGLSMLPEDDEVRALRRDVDDMAGMLDAFLEFAREDAAEAAVKQDLVALLRDCVDDAHRGHLPVTFSQTPQAAEVPVRGAAVKRAVMNLITNGARHGDQVQVSLTLFERSARITVEDNGPGIAPEDREAAMRPFTRLAPERSQNDGGSVGLGLAIAADTARVHGGSLRLSHSASLGGLRADLLLAR